MPFFKSDGSFRMAHLTAKGGVVLAVVDVRLRGDIVQQIESLQIRRHANAVCMHIHTVSDNRVMLDEKENKGRDNENKYIEQRGVQKKRGKGGEESMRALIPAANCAKQP